MAALVLHLRRRWRNDDGLELRRVGRRCLAPTGQGALRGAEATLFAPVGQRRCCVARLVLAGSRRNAVYEAICPSGRAGRRAGRTGKNRFAYSSASFEGWQTRPEHGGRFARGENCPLFPRPPRFRNHPAGRLAGSARTRPRDQSLGYPFLGNRAISPVFPSPRPPKRRRRQVPARGLAAVCTLTAPPETQRSIHAPCSWGMDASSRSRRRWPPALPALPAWHHPSTADTGARPALYASMPSMLPALPLKAMLYHLSP